MPTNKFFRKGASIFNHGMRNLAAFRSHFRFVCICSCAAVITVALPAASAQGEEGPPPPSAEAMRWADIRQSPQQLRFDRPSDVLAAWRRWRPDDPTLFPLPSSSNGRDRSLHELDFLCNPGTHYEGGCTGTPILADDSFDDEAAAFVALSACLAPAAWVIHDRSPMLWVMETSSAWDPPNGIDFGACVHKRSPEQPNPWSRSPDTPRSHQVAAVLERKLSDYLIAHRCTGHGPDDCLTLLDALVSLAPRSPRLPSVLEALAADFSPLAEPVIPPNLAAKQGATGGPDWEAAQTIRRRVMAQVLYLTQRLRALAAQPGRELLPGEPEGTLVRLMPLAQDLLRLDGVQGTAWPQPRIGNQRRFADPWHALRAAQASPLWDRALADVGSQAAKQAAALSEGRVCPPAPTDSQNPMPESYWRGYWLASLKAGQDQCPPQGETGWAQAYIQSKDSSDPSLARFAPLREYLGNESRADAHLAMVEPIGASCPLARDPWEICAWAGSPESRRWQENPPRRLPVPAGKRFRTELLTAPGAETASPEKRFEAALARLERKEGKTLPDVRALLAKISDVSPPELAARWWHPKSKVRAVQLTLPAKTDGEEPPQGLLLYGDTAPRLVRLPGRFGQYDDGNLAALSDLDGDGRLEAWFAGVWGECDGEGSVPGRDCSITLYHLGGEVFGDRIGPFIKGPLPTVKLPVIEPR